MNPTIEKIISMLFEDIVETEETRALHDEILNNCQERYQDMLSRGVSEDEAIHAVMESLAGMDEVLAQYPRKAQEDEEGGPFCFDPTLSPVRSIDIHLVSEDVSLSPSLDGRIHVACHNPGGIRVFQKDGVLRVERSKAFAAPAGGGDWLSRLLQNLSVQIRLGFGGDVDVQLPPELCPELTVCTSSGDINAEGVRLAALRADSTSGDLCFNHIVVNGEAHLGASSGDLDWNGGCVLLKAASLSGDIHAQGSFEEASLTTTSGDVDIVLSSERLKSLTARTTSGDVNASLQGGVPVRLRCHTVSGDVRQRVATAPDASAAVDLSSVSGDITVD
ncbi:MAG: DUF4097 domain-containing protein [Clostridiales bacterium]|nr:DUF4097 domain-containing protein [Clostridiales bacterium]MDO4351188.1 DUF4097 family beta strand repeat-containing protein [Eubacteriales bacterium]MDY4008988.1 DUF4097 family beta strand repeat-containing protein [Candidatus Limiplasma sp.]